MADIHFVPEIASIAAQYVDKVRINPGNYRTDRGEFEALVEQCRRRGVALRIGVNHGSLAKRIFDRWGDTPEGMVVSAMEFLRICRRLDFDQVVVSMKSSNTRVMVAAYRLLVEAMDAEGCATRSIWASPRRATDSKGASRAPWASAPSWPTASATRSASRSPKLPSTRSP